MNKHANQPTNQQFVHIDTLFVLGLHLLEHGNTLVQSLHTQHLVVTAANGHRIGLSFVITHHQNIVELSKLGFTHHLIQSAASLLQLHLEVLSPQGSLHLLSVLHAGGVHGDDNGLARAQPEGPLALEVLQQDGEGTLHGTQNGAVDHHRTLHGSLGTLVAQVKADGELEVQLDGGGLVYTTKAVQHLNINLGTIERSVTRVDLPVASTDELVQGLAEVLLGLIPQLDFSHGLLGTSGQLQLEGHTEDAVDMAHEVQHTTDLLLDLVRAAEDVGVILLEATHTGETVESARKLVTVENTEVSQTDGQL